ncbi:hypothetical protein GCM10028821_44790 [Hymenobacter jeollabukensis]
MDSMDWFAADVTWQLLGYPTLNSFLQTWVPKARFHSLVPEDVRNAYRTTSYLLANSWHHYPMYDQGLQHLLGILEMAVKFRAEQLGIAVTSSSQHRHSQPPKLANLIDLVCRRAQAQELKQKLHWARKMRNYHAHPDRYRFAPVVMQQAVLPLLNLLNELFIDPMQATQAEQQMRQLRRHSQVLHGKLLILEYQGLRYLMHQAEPLRAFYSADHWRSLWAFYPVLPQAHESLSQHRYLPPIVLSLRAVEKESGGFQALDVTTGRLVRVLVNQDVRNQEVWEAHQQAWRLADRTDRWLFASSQQSNVRRAQHQLEHEFGWSYGGGAV